MISIYLFYLTEQEKGDDGEDDDENSWDWPQQPAQPVKYTSAYLKWKCIP